MKVLNDLEDKRYYCEKCGKTMRGSEFYTSYNLEKYPNDGKLSQCKKCITMHVDNWNPDTFLWILQEVDVPWIPDEWNKLMSSYARDPSKVTGATIIGRYIGKMRLNQFKDFRWKDTAFLKELNDSRVEQSMKSAGYDIQQITTALNKRDFAVPDEPISKPQYDDPAPYTLDSPPPPPPPQEPEIEDYFSQHSAAPEPEPLDLTEEDRLYLRLKWGKTYKPEEWVVLEQLYNDMMESYDIQQAGHIDTLKLICKTSLKSNQLLDIGDVDGAQKMVKMYEALMKSGKFTAAQNKAESGEFIDSFSEFFSLCEKDGFVPRYYISQPNDKVDETLADLEAYTHDLVVNEQNLGNLIENAVKEMMRQENKEEDSEADDEENLTMDEVESIKDEDFAEYTEFVEDEAEQDDATVLKMLEEANK